MLLVRRCKVNHLEQAQRWRALKVIPVALLGKKHKIFYKHQAEDSMEAVAGEER